MRSERSVRWKAARVRGAGNLAGRSRSLFPCAESLGRLSNLWIPELRNQNPSAGHSQISTHAQVLATSENQGGCSPGRESVPSGTEPRCPQQ